MSRYKIAVARHVGLPPQPDPAMCPGCGGLWPVATATTWLFCQPVFGAHCPACDLVFCVAGHVLTEFYAMDGLTDHGADALGICVTGPCADARELISHDFEVLAEGQEDSPVTQMVLRRWAGYYEGIPAWHWVHSTAVQAEKVSVFFDALRQNRR